MFCALCYTLGKAGPAERALPAKRAREKTEVRSMNEFWRTFWMVAPFLSGALQLTATVLVIAACLKYLFSGRKEPAAPVSAPPQAGPGPDGSDG